MLGSVDLSSFFFPFSRYSEFQKVLTSIEKNEPGGLDAFSKSYEKFGIHVSPDGTAVCYEWCPEAKDLYLWGEFSQ